MKKIDIPLELRKSFPRLQKYQDDMNNGRYHLNVSGVVFENNTIKNVDGKTKEKLKEIDSFYKKIIF